MKNTARLWTLVAVMLAIAVVLLVILAQQGLLLRSQALSGYPPQDELYTDARERGCTIAFQIQQSACLSQPAEEQEACAAAAQEEYAACLERPTDDLVSEER